jgi:hypothetical protein
MYAEYPKMLPVEFDDSSRVWIYQSNRPFTKPESLQIEDLLKNFITSWNSHGTPVKGYGQVFFSQFIILIADEKASSVSGCSTDSSVHLIKEMENLFAIELFDRNQLAFLVNDQVQLISISQLKSGINNGIVKRETLYFNNTVTTKKELENNWIIPLKNSWLANRISFPQPI